MYQSILTPPIWSNWRSMVLPWRWIPHLTHWKTSYLRQFVQGVSFWWKKQRERYPLPWRLPRPSLVSAPDDLVDLFVGVFIIIRGLIALPRFNRIDQIRVVQSLLFFIFIVIAHSNWIRKQKINASSGECPVRVGKLVRWQSRRYPEITDMRQSVFRQQFMAPKDRNPLLSSRQRRSRLFSVSL